MTDGIIYKNSTKKYQEIDKKYAKAIEQYNSEQYAEECSVKMRN